MGYGQDSSLHYERVQKRYPLSQVQTALPEAFRGFAHRREDTLKPTDFETFIVGFCGKLYPAVHTWRAADGGEQRYIYEPQELLEFGKNRYGYWAIESYNEAILLSGIRHDRIFLEVDAPVFSVMERDEYRGEQGCPCLITNTSLKAVEFFRVADAFTAFQEIAMYLGNQLVKRDEVSEVADKYKIAQHGYDKHSFRKEKEGQ
jgi:hypothetical protein